MAMSIYLTERDRALLQELQQRHGVTSSSQFFRAALEAYQYTMTSESAAPPEADGLRQSIDSLGTVPLSVSSIIIPEKKTNEGVLIRSTSAIWKEIVDRLGQNWSFAYELPPERWEELIATAFHKEGFDQVTLTRRSGDDGRDVIAIKNGVGCVKVIGSVKAYRPGRLVRYDDVRALLGVLSGESDASKGVVTTTSDFPKRMYDARFIKQFIPYRLELMNGTQLRDWLVRLNGGSK